MKKVTQSDISRAHQWANDLIDKMISGKITAVSARLIVEEYEYLLREALDELKALKNKRTKVTIECDGMVCRGVSN